MRDDWSGESRDPATLSGGETFVVSLALALGLADVITQEAGGADLDTLFVDEGFGSLDADTLDDVMDTLDSLRDGGRVVGVVSHVAEMRDRIPTQLRGDQVPDRLDGRPHALTDRRERHQDHDPGDCRPVPHPVGATPYPEASPPPVRTRLVVHDPVVLTASVRGISTSKSGWVHEKMRIALAHLRALLPTTQDLGPILP